MMTYSADMPTGDPVVSTLEAQAEDAGLPCPSPACANLPSAADRFCEACGTWLGVEGEKPPSTGPLQKALRTTGALKIAGMVERVEGKLNDWCD